MLLKNWRNIKKVVAPKRVWMKYLLHLHDNAPAQKARIVTMYLEAKIVIILPYPIPSPLFSPDLARATSFWSLKFHLSGKGFTKCPWVCTLSVYDWRPFEEYEKCFQTWIDRLKGQRWVLWGHGRIKKSKINKIMWVKSSKCHILFLEHPSYVRTSCRLAEVKPSLYV